MFHLFLDNVLYFIKVSFKFTLTTVNYAISTFLCLDKVRTLGQDRKIKLKPLKGVAVGLNLRTILKCVSLNMNLFV